MTNLRRIFLTITLGLLASLGYYMWYQNQHYSVPVARLEIAEGAAIDKGCITTRPFPRTVVQEGWVFDPDQIVGKVARTTIYPGEPFDKRRLADPSELVGVRVGPDKFLSPGMVAFGVPVTIAGAVGGMLRSGDYVDVIAVMPEQEGEILLQYVKVLDVRSGAGRPVYPDEGGIGVVVLELAPEQAALLAERVTRGQLFLALTGHPPTASVPHQGSEYR
ncbi:MAG TPA: Flp pilus assembly protein CpaB [Anaerolineae bacterium]|nr:Flp pilus assembly protein CpaB [Anaerolineae bacterium]